MISVAVGSVSMGQLCPIDWLAGRVDRMESRAKRSIRRGDDRAMTVEPGIVGRHCFSYGPHYDPGNVAFGPLVAANTFELEPGAAFETHEHAGVEIISWVVRGELT